MKIKLIIITLLVSTVTFAQQEPMFTHYMYNTTVINPAYAGSRDALTVTGLYRNQWFGFDGAPVTQTLNIHSPIFAGLGLGLSVLNDAAGPAKNTSYNLDISYRIKFEKSYLAFGLKGGFNTFNLDYSYFQTTEQDPLLTRSNEKYINPNFGAGIYYYADRYYIGASVPKLFENTDVDKEGAETVRHYYFIAGAVFNINDNIKLKPTTFIKLVPQIYPQVDVTATFVFFDKFNVGAMYRTDDSFGLLAGLNVTDQLSVGYSFDWSTGIKTGTYNNGSHEIMIRYDFDFISRKKIKSPRNF